MSNNKWMDDPVLEGISKERLEVLTNIIEGAKGMEPKDMFTYFIRQSNMAGKQGINFTNAETELILNVLKEDMSPEEIKRVDMVKQIVNSLQKEKALKAFSFIYSFQNNNRLIYHCHFILLLS